MAPAEMEVDFEYLRDFKLLLCKTCGYCVLPQALDRHLKALHHLPIASRRSHLDSIKDLDLVALAGVTYPEPGGPPITHLPSFQGFACAAPKCQYLSVTAKRMQAHWREKHFRLSQTVIADHDRYGSVKLQTFFHGTNVRYFRVAHHTGSKSQQLRRHTENTRMPVAKVLLSAFDNESSTGWLLTRQFCEKTYQALTPVKGTRDSWRDQVFDTSANNDYMRYAVLALTASYVASQNAGQREFYGLEADRYRQLAIKTFPTGAHMEMPRMFFEVFNFSRLMTLCCIAKTQYDLPRATDCATWRTNPVVPDWLRVQRRGRALLWKHRGEGRITNAMHGPRQPLFEVFHRPEPDVSRDLFGRQVQQLESALEILTLIDVDSSCIEALRLLRKASSMPAEYAGLSFRDVALMWTARVSDQYIGRMQGHDPIALIVFAYFCVLWSKAEERYWYMQGLAEPMLSTIVHILPSEWQSWIVWPITMLLGPRKTQVARVTGVDVT